jgi:hypothetical protein
MVMRRGQHTSRVLEAMRVPDPDAEPELPAVGDALDLLTDEPNLPQ